MKTEIFPVLLAFCIGNLSSFCQVSINTDGSSPDKSAILEVKSQSKGLLFPRLTTAQIRNIWQPSPGLMVYNVDSADFYGFTGVNWKAFFHSGDTIARMCEDSIFYSGQWYTTVQIGTQCWMAENLNVGTQIPGTTPQTSNGTIEKHCYLNSADSCAIYGGLYQYFEASNYSTSPGVQGICPPGWHVPTGSQYDVLADYLGGGSVAGGPLKATGFRYWDSPNTGATNATGFTALGGGTYDPVYGNGFYMIHEMGIFWTSTYDGWAWRRDIYNTDVSLSPYACQSNHSFSVRCLKNQ